jgi:hypothetical protein
MKGRQMPIRPRNSRAHSTQAVENWWASKHNFEKGLANYRKQLSKVGSEGSGILAVSNSRGSGWQATGDTTYHLYSWPSHLKNWIRQTINLDERIGFGFVPFEANTYKFPYMTNSAGLTNYTLNGNAGTMSRFTQIPSPNVAKAERINFAFDGAANNAPNAFKKCDRVQLVYSKVQSWTTNIYLDWDDTGAANPITAHTATVDGGGGSTSFTGGLRSGIAALNSRDSLNNVQISSSDHAWVDGLIALDGSRGLHVHNISAAGAASNYMVGSANMIGWNIGQWCTGASETQRCSLIVAYSTDTIDMGTGATATKTAAEWFAYWDAAVGASASYAVVPSWLFVIAPPRTESGLLARARGANHPLDYRDMAYALAAKYPNQVAIRDLWMLFGLSTSHDTAWGTTAEGGLYDLGGKSDAVHNNGVGHAQVAALLRSDIIPAFYEEPPTLSLL